MERRLAAILAADIVGYSAMMGADEAAALEAVRLLREELFEPEVARLRGEVVKRMGDGWLVEFASVVDAVRCAVATQETLADRDFALRIGVHLGDIVHADGDIYGDGVNIAARLEAKGAPGHVLISDDARRQIAGKIDAVFHDNGAVELKNIAEPMRVWSWPEPLPGLAKAAATAKPGVHVVLFEARGDEAEDLAEGLRDDLAAAFMRQTSLMLAPEAEKADFVVSGAIRASGGRWRISAHLTECATGQRLWSERLDDTGDDIFAIQDRFAFRIAGTVRIRLTRHAAAKVVGRPLEDLTVDELLNLATGSHLTPTRESWEGGIPLLELVLERDPDRWMAMAMLATSYFGVEYFFSWRGIEPQLLEKALGLIRRAQSLNGESDFVRAIHAAMLMNAKHDLSAARIEAEQCLAISSSFGQGLCFLGEIEAFSGNFERAKSLALQCMDCDPNHPFYHLFAHGAGRVFAAAGEYAAAAGWFQRANSAAPGLPAILVGLTAARMLSGDAAGAREAMAWLMAEAPDFNLDELEPWPFGDPADWAPFHAALAEAGAPAKPMRDQIRLVD